MNKKILIGVGVIIICAFAITCFLGGDGIFSPKTSFSTKFLDGEIQGNAFQEPDLGRYRFQDFQIEFTDYSNSIYYYFNVQKNISFLIDYYKWLGVKKISDYEYNGINWTVYYFDAKANSKSINGTSKINGYCCVASRDGIDYLISVSSDKIPSNNSTDSELFKNYVKPLIESLTLKKTQNVPYLYEWWGFKEEEFNMMVNNAKENGFDSIFNWFFLRGD